MEKGRDTILRESERGILLDEAVNCCYSVNGQ